MPADTPVAVVTGGSSGIGLATAVKFSQEGWCVAICGRNGERLRTAAQGLAAQSPEAQGEEEIRASSLPPLTAAIDVSDQDALRDFVNEVQEAYGRIDVWVNNAGVAPMAPLEELGEADLQQTLDVNCGAIFHATRAVWPLMKTQGHGTIINISSLAAFDPFAGFSLYGASKAWVNLFTTVTAQEGEPLGIRVFAVCPGAVETPLLRQLFPDYPADATLAPEQVAETIWKLTQSDNTTPVGSAIKLEP